MKIKRNCMSKRFLRVLLLFFVLSFFSCTAPQFVLGDQQISAPLMTDSADKMGQQAIRSVFRIFCPSQNRMGSGFLHKSGKVITAAHVVRGCEPKDILLILPKGNKMGITKIMSDDNLDLALLSPDENIAETALPLSSNKVITIGTQVSTWGFPAGYMGISPILSVGYIAGIDTKKTDSGKFVKRIVVNAAFNSGNSGGPLIEIDSGTVIGVVSSKLAPIPPYIENALRALKNSKFGLIMEKRRPDGTVVRVSQSQVLEEILQYLRSQTQLVVGMAVLPHDIQSFLKGHKINP